jgi:hypothetical protein
MIRAQRNSVRIGFGFITSSLLVPEVVAGVGRMAVLFGAMSRRSQLT